MVRQRLAFGHLTLLIVSYIVAGSSLLAAQTEKTLWGFRGPDGQNPMSALVFDASGTLYGTTSEGGSNSVCPGGCGTAFALTPNSDGTWSESVIHNFGYGTDGENPHSSLVIDRFGRFLGTTEWGGAYLYGTVFQLEDFEGGWTESLLFAFNGQTNGSNPISGLTQQGGAHLYGTAYSTPPGDGMVFDLGAISTLHWYNLNPYFFTGNLDGGEPNGPLVSDREGNLYGTTAWGGAHGFGTVFKLTPNDGSWIESTIYSFQGPPDDGAYSAAGLAFDTDGNLYGTTLQSAGFCTIGWCGVVFKLSPNPDGSWSESVLHIFQGHFQDGEEPVAAVIVDSAGNVYGTTNGGGTYGSGTVYKLAPSAGGQYTESVLWSFTGSGDGANPSGALIFDGAGNLYGTTQNGGNVSGQSFGTVFEIVLAPH